MRGLTDAEARLLPTRVDASVVADLPISMWMTDAGELSLFDSLPHKRRGERTYEQLVADGSTRRISGVATPLASIDDLIGGKQFADRGAIDTADLAELEKIRDVQARSRTPARDQAARRWGLEL